MTPSLEFRRFRDQAAFSLVEIVVVIAILVTLMSVGVSLLNGTGSHSRKAGTDLFAGLIEQARTTAITSRCYVVLAIAEPGDLPTEDGRCRVGLFKVETWPDDLSNPVKCVPLSRWRPLEAGVVLIGGRVDGVENLLDGDEFTIEYGATKPLAAKVHAIAFNARGGLHYPAGSSPVAVRIAEGNYRSGKPVAFPRGAAGGVTENRLKIGRITARPYRIDG